MMHTVRCKVLLVLRVNVLQELGRWFMYMYLIQYVLVPALGSRYVRLAVPGAISAQKAARLRAPITPCRIMSRMDEVSWLVGVWP
jgi:hypothetical protein